MQINISSLEAINSRMAPLLKTNSYARGEAFAAFENGEETRANGNVD